MADSVAGMPGTEVVVPVRAEGFHSIITAQGSITFDPDVVRLKGVEQYGLAGMDSSNFRIMQNAQGKLLFSWDDATLEGQSLANEAVLFAMRFKVIGDYGSISVINFTDSPTKLEFANSNFAATTVALKAGKVQVPAYAIITSPLDQDTLCVSSSIPVAFTAHGVYDSGNFFTVQLSDEKGSFQDAITVGEGTQSPIIVTLSAGITEGTKYRIRVVASSPAIVGSDNGHDISIGGLPSAPAVVHSNTCGPGSVTLSASGAPLGGSYRWYADASGSELLAAESSGVFITPTITASATYYVAAVNSMGCESERVPVQATVVDLDSVIVGPDEEVCIDDAPFLLEEGEPTGGVWSGTGVGATGVFNPLLAGEGTHQLTYTITCQNGSIAEASKNIRVIDVRGVPSIAQIGVDSLVTDIIGASYEWEANGRTFTSTSNKIRISEPGFYKVRVFDGGCVSELSDIFTASFYADFVVYPNPSIGVVTVSGPTLEEGLEIEVFNSIGKRVYQKTLRSFSGKEKVDLGHLSADLYFMSLRTSKMKMVVKLAFAN
ncbi:T9SS type A sorting domain-containing protein [Pontibacter harenae]|uniref:Ig-like domain-containing protein n=1 Tax=Pontibacter harenae TaxID=2894083 RepID=UPI001E380E8D|nr:T9SS type A sorting domain-containing protein [Pontibacter harenae]MCC9166857.1 T9SS type A sorting domain-containing protein [Pontibacter harenae]